MLPRCVNSSLMLKAELMLIPIMMELLVAPTTTSLSQLPVCSDGQKPSTQFDATNDSLILSGGRTKRRLVPEESNPFIHAMAAFVPCQLGLWKSHMTTHITAR